MQIITLQCCVPPSNSDCHISICCVQVAHANKLQLLRDTIDKQAEQLLAREDAEAASRRTLHERVVALARLVEAMGVKVRRTGSNVLGGVLFD